ncbi:MAG: hypothetical protein U0487_00745 [Patescibacteria group bacterium]
MTNLRHGDAEFKPALAIIRGWIRKGKLSYFDIGTSEGEVEKLRLGSVVLRVKKIAKAILDGTDEHQNPLPYLRMLLRDGGISYEEIGIKEADLAIAHAKNQRRSVRSQLERLRTTDSYEEREIRFFKERALSVFDTLEDAGTSEHELKLMQKRFKKDALEKELQKLKDDSSSMSMSDFVQSLVSYGFTLSDFGLKEEDLAAMDRRSHIAMAKRDFTALKSKPKANEYFELMDSPFEQYREVKQSLARGGLSPADIGTTEEELRELIRQRIIRLSKLFLQTKRGVGKREPYFGSVRLLDNILTLLFTGWATYEDLETTKEEIERLIHNQTLVRHEASVV